MIFCRQQYFNKRVHVCIFLSYCLLIYYFVRCMYVLYLNYIQTYEAGGRIWRRIKNGMATLIMPFFTLSFSLVNKNSVLTNERIRKPQIPIRVATRVSNHYSLFYQLLKQKYYPVYRIRIQPDPLHLAGSGSNSGHGSGSGQENKNRHKLA